MKSFITKPVKFNYKVPTTCLGGPQKVGRRKVWYYKTTSLDIDFWRISLRLNFRTIK